MWQTDFRLHRQHLEEHMGCALEDYERAVAVQSRWFVDGPTPGGRRALEEHMGCALEDYERVVTVESRWFVNGPMPGGRQSNCAHMYRYTKCSRSL